MRTHTGAHTHMHAQCHSDLFHSWGCICYWCVFHSSLTEHLCSDLLGEVYEVGQPDIAAFPGDPVCTVRKHGPGTGSCGDDEEIELKTSVALGALVAGSVCRLFMFCWFDQWQTPFYLGLSKVGVVEKNVCVKCVCVHAHSCICVCVWVVGIFSAEYVYWQPLG